MAIAGRARVQAEAHVSPGAVYGYARVSTVQQVDEGESLDVQQRTVAGYALQHGLQLARTFVERGVSGAKPLGDRPQGAALLALLRPGDVVLCAKLDRMFRSALDAQTMLKWFKDRGIALHLMDLGGDVVGNGGNMVAKLTFTILSAVAEAERDRTRERITEVKRDQKARGRFLGGIAPPFGHIVGDAGQLVPHPKQQAAIRKMKRLKAKGLSLRAIAAAIQADGVPISFVTVKQVLDRG